MEAPLKISRRRAIKYIKRLVSVVSGLTFSLCGYANSYADTYMPYTNISSPYDASTLTLNDFPWAVTGYVGKLTNKELPPLLIFDYGWNSQMVYSAEFSHQLAETNPIRQLLQSLLTTIEVAGNFTYRDDPVGAIYEFDPYFMFRWVLPWKKYIVTSLAIGEGVSFDSKISQYEAENGQEDAKKILNFLMIEAAFSLPQYPQWELAYRLHHRSGAFGVYSGPKAGSTAVGVALRYRF